jgi:hypothetical protein
MLERIFYSLLTTEKKCCVICSMSGRNPNFLKPSGRVKTVSILFSARRGRTGSQLQNQYTRARPRIGRLPLE